MRILYVISGYGAEHLGYEISRELGQEIIARGHAYTIFAPARLREMKGRTADALEDGVPVHREIAQGELQLELLNRLSQPIFKFPWFISALLRLLNYLHTHRTFDLIVGEGAYPYGAIVYLATRVFRHPYMIYVNGADFIANPAANYGYARFRLARGLMRREFAQAAVVRAESIYGAKNARKLGCPPEKLALVQRNISRVTFLPQGVDAEAYRRAARAKIRAQFNLSAPRVIVAVGRLLPIKGFDDLVRALPLVSARVGDTQILHVGPNRIDSKFGDYQKYLQNLANELGVGEKIVFAGAVELAQVRDLIAAADVLAAPSVEEGGTKMVMEAAAAATPFVGTRTAGTPEWAQEWNCGLIVNARAPEELADALAQILGEPALARRMGANGQKFAEHFRTAQVATRILGLAEVALRRAPVPYELKEPYGLLHPTFTS